MPLIYLCPIQKYQPTNPHQRLQAFEAVDHVLTRFLISSVRARHYDSPTTLRPAFSASFRECLSFGTPALRLYQH